MKLSPKLKCLVKLIWDKCDLSGVWSPNWIIAQTYIGEPVNEQELLEIDGGKQFKKLPGGKIFCTDFIQFQYGVLSKKSPVHKKILSILHTHKIPYKYPINRVQEEEEEKEKEKEKEKEEEKGKGGIGGKPITEREEDFYRELENFKEQYPEQMLKDFALYWTETNKSGSKMRFETEKIFNLARRLARWKANQKNFSKNGKHEVTIDSMREHFKKKFGHAQ